MKNKYLKKIGVGLGIGLVGLLLTNKPVHANISTEKERLIKLDANQDGVQDGNIRIRKNNLTGEMDRNGDNIPDYSFSVKKDAEGYTMVTLDKNTGITTQYIFSDKGKGVLQKAISEDEKGKFSYNFKKRRIKIPFAGTPLDMSADYSREIEEVIKERDEEMNEYNTKINRLEVNRRNLRKILKSDRTDVVDYLNLVGISTKIEDLRKQLDYKMKIFGVQIDQIKSEYKTVETLLGKENYTSLQNKYYETKDKITRIGISLIQYLK